MTNSKTRINRYRKMRKQFTRTLVRCMEEAARESAKYYDEMMALPLLREEYPFAGLKADPLPEERGSKTYAEAILLAEQGRAEIFGIPVVVNKYLPPGMIVMTDGAGNVKGIVKTQEAK